jgi:hypothetical protein
MARNPGIRRCDPGHPETKDSTEPEQLGAAYPILSAKLSNLPPPDDPPTDLPRMIEESDLRAARPLEPYRLAIQLTICLLRASRPASHWPACESLVDTLRVMLARAAPARRVGCAQASERARTTARGYRDAASSPESARPPQHSCAAGAVS